MSTLWEENLEVMDAADVHWGASTILAIFFAASLISACFFGLGYSFGRGGTSSPVGSAALYNANPPAPEAAPNQSMPERDAKAATISAQRTAIHPALTQASATRITHPVANSVKTANSGLSTARSTPVVSHAAAEHYMIQVGAIDNRRDARTLVSSLRKRGFHAGIYESKHDKFLHVQLGPFATAEQAQNMRHHVIASGYRAILKRAS